MLGKNCRRINHLILGYPALSLIADQVGGYVDHLTSVGVVVSVLYAGLCVCGAVGGYFAELVGVKY